MKIYINVYKNIKIKFAKKVQFHSSNLFRPKMKKKMFIVARYLHIFVSKI